MMKLKDGYENIYDEYISTDFSNNYTNFLSSENFPIPTKKYIKKEINKKEIKKSLKADNLEFGIYENLKIFFVKTIKISWIFSLKIRPLSARRNTRYNKLRNKK